MYDELEEELQRHPEWLDLDSIAANVNKDPRIMMQLCQRETLREKALLANSQSIKDFIANLKTPSRHEKFVIATLEALRESTKSVDKPRESIFGDAFGFAAVGGQDSAKKAAIDELERELILAQSGYDDPRVLEVPLRFARAVSKLCPKIGSSVDLHPTLKNSLLSILDGGPMRIAFSEEENQHLIAFITYFGAQRDDIRGIQLLHRLQQFALYCSCYPSAFLEYCPETFQNFVTIIKLKSVVHKAIELCTGADEKAIGEALYNRLNKIYILSDFAFCIDDFLNIKTPGIKATSFLCALMKNLKPFVPTFEEEFTADKKGWDDDVRLRFREAFYFEYLENTSNYVDDHQSYNL